LAGKKETVPPDISSFEKRHIPLLSLGLARRSTGARLKIQARTRFDQIQVAERPEESLVKGLQIGGWESTEEVSNNLSSIAMG